MSILIKGMEMPEHCDECYIREKNTCPITKTNVTGWGIPLNCPLVTVPKHGRLIDADALMYNIGDVPYKGSVRRVLLSAPTIIEAEDGE